MDYQTISSLLEIIEDKRKELDRKIFIDLNIKSLEFTNKKEIDKIIKLKLKKIIDYCFSVLLLIDSNKLDSNELANSIRIKALYLKLDLLFDVKDDPSKFNENYKKVIW